MSMDPAVGDFQRADVLVEGKKIVAVRQNITAGDASVLDALAAAYASAGAFDRAVTTARAAVVAAGPAGLSELAAEIRTRITLYERKEAVVINP